MFNLGVVPLWVLASSTLRGSAIAGIIDVSGAIPYGTPSVGAPFEYSVRLFCIVAESKLA